MSTKNLLQTIGNTPLVEVKGLGNGSSSVYAKLEYFNPGGSVKDRTALFLIEDAEKKGLLKKGSTIIEPTAGNTGIGLALIGVQKGYSVQLVVPEKFSAEKQVLMKALGAEVIITPTEDGMEGAILKAKSLASEIPNSFVPEQFSNAANVEAHYTTTGPEILNELSDVDYFVAGFGTGGTFTGVSKYLKEQAEKNGSKKVQCVVVEPEGSILAGGEGGTHKIEGIGVHDMKTAQLLDRSLIDEVITVTDNDAHAMMQSLAKEGFLVGSSSAAAAVACKQLVEKHKGESLKIVTVFPDGSDRYLSKKVYGEFDEWK